MLAAIRAPSAATSTADAAAPSAVRVASVTFPPYVPEAVLERLPARPATAIRAAHLICGLTCAPTRLRARWGGRSRHGDEWCRVGASGLLCRPVGRQGPSGLLRGPREDRCRR